MAETRFSITPQQAELDGIARVLLFHPTVNSNPITLTSSQVVQFNRDGFVKGISLFNDDEANDYRRYFDELLMQVTADGGDSYSISSAHLKYGRVYDLLTHPAIVACVRDLLGENVVAWGSHYFCKMPGDGKAVTWHQDASYWPLTPTKAVTVWLAIDDADRDNACMWFIPGSHLHGHIAYRSSAGDESNVLDQTVENAAQYGREPVPVELKSGEISIHSDLLLHGSEANNSDRRRCGLTLRYCAADVRAYLDWNRKGILVAGSDSTHHWANPQRPAQD